VTAGDFIGLGNVTPASFDPPEADPPLEADPPAPLPDAAASAFAASSDDVDLPAPPFSLPDDGNFGLVVREVARRADEAGGGVAPEADDLPEFELSEFESPDFEDSDCVFSGRSGLSADFDEPPSASAAVRSEDLSLPSGVSPFMLSDSGLGSTLFRTTVSG
jgi:hypothetical protein